MAGRDLDEPRSSGQGREAALVLRIFPRVHQHDGASTDAHRTRLGKGLTGAGFIEPLDLAAINADAAANLDHTLVEHARKSDLEVEQARPRLVADPKRIGKAAIDHKEGALTLQFEERIGGDGSAHLDGVDRAGRDARVERQAKHGLDAGDRGIAIAVGVLAEQLVG